MPNFFPTEKQRQSLNDQFSRQEHLVAVWLHGSAVTKNFRADSDIDMALMYKPGKQPEGRDLLELASGLSEALGREVDLGLLDSRNPVYGFQALQKGTVLYSVDGLEKTELMNEILRAYFDLKIARAEVEDAYRIG